MPDNNAGPKVRVNGPEAGNRNRNTFANLLSKYQVGGSNPGGAAALPALSPADTAAYFGQVAAIEAGLRNQMAALRAERVGIRAGFRTERAGIKQQVIGGIVGISGESQERGILGSSAELEQRIGVRAAGAGAIAQSRNEMLQGLAANRLAGQQAQLGAFQASSQLAAQALAARQTQLAAQLQQNLIISGQESTMDILKALYQAQSQALAAGTSLPPVRRGAGGAAVTGGIPPEAVAARIAAGRM